MDNSICILIPTKNRKHLLERCINSLINQTVKPEEVVIINDGSTDGTIDFLNNLSLVNIKITIINRVKSGGVNVARNQGIKISTCDWVMFLDDDDELVNDAIFVAKEKISQFPKNYNLFYFNTITKLDKDQFIGGFQFKEGQSFYDPSYEEVMVKFGLKGDCKPIFRKAIFDTNKYWFPEIVNGFESIIIKKMAKDDVGIRYYNEISTIMNLQQNFEHLSFSASAKNPKVFLRLNIDDLNYHIDFYNKNRKYKMIKYVDIIKLSIRSFSFVVFLKYIFRLLFKI